MTTAAVVFVICFAYFVQAAFGFGAGLIALPLLSLMIDPKTAVVILAIFPVLTSVVLIPLRHDIDWKKIIRLGPGIAIGLPFGLFLFASTSGKLISICLALFVLVYVAGNFTKRNFFAAIEDKLPAHMQPFAVGLATGILSGLLGNGGPPMAAYLQKNTSSAVVFRATLLAIFLCVNIVRCFFLGMTNFIRGDVIHYSLIALPFFAVAIFAGYHVPKKISQSSFDTGINVLLLLSAFSILAKQIL